MFNNLSKRERNMFWIALVVLLVGFYYFQMLQPVLVEKAAMEEETDSLRRQYQAMLGSIQKRLPDVQRRLTEIQAQYRTKVANFPQEAEISTLLFEIEQIATARGVKLEQFNPKAMSDRGDFYELPVQASFFSSYIQMVRFLDALEHSPKRMSVGRLDVKKSTMEDRSELQVDITLNMYITKKRI